MDKLDQLGNVKLENAVWEQLIAVSNRAGAKTIVDCQFSCQFGWPSRLSILGLVGKNIGFCLPTLIPAYLGGD